MQFAVTALIDAARSRLAAKVPSSPMAPIAAPAHPQRRPTAFASLENPLTKHPLFTLSPLTSETNPAAVDLLDAIFRSEAVQHAAGTCAAKHQRLIEMAGIRSEISAAIQIAVANDDDLDITPAMVVEVLRQRAEEIDDAIANCQEDRARHDVASRARVLRHQPLRAAASKRLDQLIAERASLLQADDAERRAASIGLAGASRYAVLRSAGLSDAQIEATEPTALNPDVLVARRRARIAEILPQIEKLRAFSVSPSFDAALLAGLGFDDLVIARDGEKATA